MSVPHETNRFLLSNDGMRERVCAIVHKLPEDPLHEVNIGLFKRQRSLKQNAMLWLLLTRIQDYVVDSVGVVHDKEAWHWKLRVEFGYVVDTMEIQLPDGQRLDVPVPKSSTKMTVAEFSEYYTQVEVFAAEKGVMLGEYW